MIIFAAVLLIVVVLAAAVFVVGTNVIERPKGERLHALKDWQSLIGSVLGFMGAAGVLVLGTSIQNDQTRAEALKREHTIGLALAYEAEALTNEIAGMIAIVNIINTQPEGTDWSYACNELVKELANSIDGDKPVWTAALGEMVGFGDQNLQLFVRYHLYYDELVELVTEPDPRLCQNDPRNEINRYGDRFVSIVDLYRDIATLYGTTLVEPEPLVRGT
jgi:hypothetical protein